MATQVRRVGAVLASEWIKLRSLRSMPVTLLVAAVSGIGLAALVCTGYHARWHLLSPVQRAHFSPVGTSLGFLQVGMVFFGVLGALTVTSEYGNGLIRGTFAATPQRGLVLAAKAALTAAVSAAAATVIVGAAFLVGQHQLAGTAPHATLASPGAVRAIAGAVFYLTCVALIGLFTGVLVRSTAVAVSAVFGIFVVLPILVDKLPHGVVWLHTVPYLPASAGVSLWHPHISGLTGPAAAASALAAWTAGLALAGAVLLRSRDT